MNPPSITVLMPVYGRTKLLIEAWESLKAQSDPAWQLLIADDGSDESTAAWIEENPVLDQRTSWLRRTKNLGLFANLNYALNSLPLKGWILLLCSDDRLLPDGIAILKNLILSWQNADWIISTHLSIDSKGGSRPCTSSKDHNSFAQQSRMINASEFVPLLLQHGSINGNLSGLAFSLQLWHKAGEFRSDWCHAADWEWLIRAVEQSPVLLNRQPVAEVRTHDGQLSNTNRYDGHELREVAAVQRILLDHPLLKDHPHRNQWARYRMQFQLWNILKQLYKGHFDGLVDGLFEIQRTVGILPCFYALLLYLPKRLKRYFNCYDSTSTSNSIFNS
jgi:glycosyltransferase involved in cell wall biosynthesis